LDNAGKTAIMLTMKGEQTISNTKPTLAMNIDTMIIRDLQFQIWDAPRQLRFRNTWQQGYQKAKIMIFVLDTAEPSRFFEANEDFLNVINIPDKRGIPIIFCFHKMDLPNTQASLPEARKIFNLSLIPRKIFQYETTTMTPQTLQKMKSILAFIVVDAL
jgi:small GTP-binding protein